MRPTTVAPAHFSWNYTTYLNLVFLVLFGVLYWIYRNRERLGAGDRYARDPVCGMQVETAQAPACSVSTPASGTTSAPTAARSASRPIARRSRTEDGSVAHVDTSMDAEVT